MTAFNDLKTGTKLIATFLAIALIIVAVAVEGYLNIESVKTGITRMYTERLLPTQQLGNVDTAQVKIKLALSRFILIPEERAELEQDIARQIESVDLNMKLYNSAHLTPEEKEAIGRFNQAWSEYQEVVTEELRLVKEGDTAPAIQSIELGGTVFTAQRAVDQVVNELSELQEHIGLEIKEKGDRTFIRSLWTMTMSGLAGVLLAVVLGVTIGRSITVPLSEITAAARTVSGGDMETDSLSGIASRRDEIGMLAGAFILMAGKLKRTLEGLRQSHDELERRVQARTQELQQSNEQLGIEIEERRQTQAKLVLRSQELARSNTELEQFAYVASHDLQEPLRMVASYVQLLEKRYRDKLDSDGREFIEFAVDGAKRMRVLIEDLLAYSRITTRAEPFKSTNLERVLETVTDNLQVAIQESDIHITHSPLPTVLGDATQLTQLFQNLISNAIKFRRDIAPELYIHAEPKEDSWLISVQDNGIGIEPQHLERIFLLFQRLHGRGAYPGTGLGLAICKKIVERHGGAIWAESEPGSGSKFSFTMPKNGGA